jgi:hypothetical protein
MVEVSSSVEKIKVNPLFGAQLESVRVRLAAMIEISLLNRIMIDSPYKCL